MWPKKTILAAVSATSLVCWNTQAFQFPATATTNIARVSTTSLDAEAMSRRTVIHSAITATTTAFVTIPPPPANAILGGATQSARVSVYPGIENIEPMYELKLSIDALTLGVNDIKKWPSIQKRLERFFKGAILSEKNFYIGVSLQYMNDIKYDDDAAYVRMDKAARFDAMESCMSSLERLKIDLGGSDSSKVEGDAKMAQDALSSWFALVPEKDVRAVEVLFQDVKGADVDRDGKLSDSELSALPGDEQEVWKRRVAKFG